MINKSIFFGVIIMIYVGCLNPNDNTSITTPEQVAEIYCLAIYNQDLKTLINLFDNSNNINFKNCFEILKTIGLKKIILKKIFKVTNGYNILVSFEMNENFSDSKWLKTIYITKQNKIKYDPFFNLHPATRINTVVKMLESNDNKIKKSAEILLKKFLIPNFSYSSNNIDNIEAIIKIKEWWEMNIIKYDLDKPFFYLSSEDIKIIKQEIDAFK